MVAGRRAEWFLINTTNSLDSTAEEEGGEGDEEEGEEEEGEEEEEGWGLAVSQSRAFWTVV